MSRPALLLNRLAPILLLIAAAYTVHAQQDSAAGLLAEGKKEWYAGEHERVMGTTDSSDVMHFRRAMNLFERAVRIDSMNQEAHYALACAIDRVLFTSTVIEDTPHADIAVTRRISHHLERALTIAPAYHGTVFVLGPWSKMTSTWGYQAMVYGAHGDADSMRWALREGRRLGGFPDYVLVNCRSILASCEQDAILFVGGDNDTFPMWYLQQIESYRRDVTVVNISLLATRWYLPGLRVLRFGGVNPLLPTAPGDRGSGLAFERINAPKQYGIPTMPRGRTMQAPAGQSINTVFHARGHEASDVRWIGLQDTAVVSILRANGWRRPVYFSFTVASEQINALGMDSALRNDGYARRLMPIRYDNEFAAVDIERYEQALRQPDAQFPVEQWRTAAGANDSDASRTILAHIFNFLYAAEYYPQTQGTPARAADVLAKMEETFPPAEYRSLYKQILDNGGEDYMHTLYTFAGRDDAFDALKRDVAAAGK